MSARLLLAATLACLALLPITPPVHAAEHIKVGVVHSLGSAPIFIAKGKGFFADEGLDAELIFFDWHSRLRSPPPRAMSISARPA